MEHSKDVIKLCVKAYLADIKHKDTSIKFLENRISEMRERLEGLGCRWVDGMPKHAPCGTGDRMTLGIAAIVELQNSWADEIAQSQKEIEHARRICEPYFTGRYACWLHCVDGLKWPKIATVIGYSERNSQLLACKGMDEIYRLMPERYRCYSIPDAITA